MIVTFLALIDDDENQEKFIAVYNKYAKFMHYISYQILHNNQIAEEAVQEAFLRIAKNIKKINDVDSYQTKYFVVVIIENVSKTIYSKEKHYSHDNLIDSCKFEVSGKLYSDEMFELISKEIIVTEILALPEKYQTPLLLFGMGYSMREVANLLGISVEAAKKRVQRARARILQRMEDEDE